MVKIRLRRTGAKKKPTYRVVVADSRTPRDGRFIEIIGHYNPRTEPVTFNIHEDRMLHWLSEGAQPTDPVRRLLDNAGTLDRFARLKAGEELDKLLAEAEASREKNQQMVETSPVEQKSPVEPEVEEAVAEAEAEESVEGPPAEVEPVEESIEAPTAEVEPAEETTGEPPAEETAEGPDEPVVEPGEDAAPETEEKD